MRMNKSEPNNNKCFGFYDPDTLKFYALPVSSA